MLDQLACFKQNGCVCNHQLMFSFKSLMIATKKKDINAYFEFWLKHGDFLTNLRNLEDEEKYGVNKFPHMEEYDRELHSESALSCLFLLFGEAKENLHHQFVPPEMVLYFSKKKEHPKERFKISYDYFNEMWQIGVMMYGLMFPEYGFPFETNK